ncbi:hypothetical protein DPMN_015840 [Dreissena polymorpha]|uniref:Uncharacterized protein n=1 Tax=Dreissena polymorpha TaxID=45954 RepID=A0A9D4S287_DREPO|nr:hypothetical protein DPMN_011872 [Dreissena polymorpha]KAH3891733.1 hypothetical protein DPMN_015840 [Dreissena polymorpha]
MFLATVVCFLPEGVTPNLSFPTAYTNLDILLSFLYTVPSNTCSNMPSTSSSNSFHCLSFIAGHLMRSNLSFVRLPWLPRSCSDREGSSTCSTSDSWRSSALWCSSWLWSSGVSPDKSVYCLCSGSGTRVFKIYPVNHIQKLQVRAKLI